MYINQNSLKLFELEKQNANETKLISWRVWQCRTVDLLYVKLMSIRIYIRLLRIFNYNLTPANCKRTLGDVVHLYGMVIELLRCLCVDYSMINRSYNSIRLIDVLSIIDISYKMHLSSFLTTKKLLCSLNVEIAFRERVLCKLKYTHSSEFVD